MDGSNQTATQTFQVTVPNRLPVAVGTLADQTLEVADGAVTVSVSGAFQDPDGDALTFTAASSLTSIVTVIGVRFEVPNGAVNVAVAGAFQDPDGDTLTYGASAAAAAVASVTMSGSEVTITPESPGQAQITVTATDVSGSNTAVTQRFGATVVAARGVTTSMETLTVQEGSTETTT